MIRVDGNSLYPEFYYLLRYFDANGAKFIRNIGPGQQVFQIHDERVKAEFFKPSEIPCFCLMLLIMFGYRHYVKLISVLLIGLVRTQLYADI